MGMDWLVFVKNQEALTTVLETNRMTQQFGLTLSEQDAELILKEHRNTLREQKRVEFGPGITEKLIYEFCDSQYIPQEEYVDILIRLQEIFYFYKNETQDQLTDDELLRLMKDQFENVCFGDLDYLEGTCLYRIARSLQREQGGCRKPGVKAGVTEDEL